MNGRATWQPLLGGALRAEALASARDVARSLRELSGPEAWAPGYGREVAASLATGTAGLALALSHLAAADVDPEAADAVDPLLDFTFETVASMEMEPDLFGGLAGIGWALSRLDFGEVEEQDEDPLGEIDAALFSALDDEPWCGAYDLGGGLAGLGLYALERLPRPAATAALARVVDHLAATAIRGGDGVTWLTAVDRLAPGQRERTPAGRFDLGVAHGIPGLVGLLAQVCAAGVAERGARPLLDGAVRWLLDRRGEGPVAFPYYCEPGGRRCTEARSAWCYGDPGVAAALLHAGRCVGEPAWERQALEIARRAAELAPEDTGVADASLCHGAAGLGHLYNRLWQRSGDEGLRGAAVDWFERALALRRPGEGHGGYLTAVADGTGGRRLEADPSLLAGAAGTALALAAAATGVEPDWDRLLLLSSPFAP